MSNARGRRDVIWASGAFLLDSDVVMWRVGLGPGVHIGPIRSRLRRQRLQGWVAHEPSAAERARTAADRPADVAWWDLSGEVTRQSRAEGANRVVEISVAHRDTTDIELMDLVGGVPLQRPIHVDGQPALVASQSLGSRDLGSVHVVAIVAGERGLPWPDVDDSHGMVGRRWASCTAGDESYFIGVFEPTRASSRTAGFDARCFGESLVTSEPRELSGPGCLRQARHERRAESRRSTRAAAS